MSVDFGAALSDWLSVRHFGEEIGFVGVRDLEKKLDCKGIIQTYTYWAFIESMLF